MNPRRRTARRASWSLRGSAPIAVLAGAIALGAAAPAAAETFVPRFMLKPPKTEDAGVFHVWSGGQAVATELFSYIRQNDSLVIGSHFRQPLRNGDTVRKVVTMMVSAFDYDLRMYNSDLEVPGHKATRGITFADSVFTAYREMDGAGEGITYLKPLGRFYALESMAFVLFDVMCRPLARREFDTWKLNVFALGDHDTLVTVTVQNLGPTPFRWGNAAVEARKLAFREGANEYLAWVGPEGKLLKLEHAASRLRVEREPPPARRAAKPKRATKPDPEPVPRATTPSGTGG